MVDIFFLGIRAELDLADSGTDGEFDILHISPDLVFYLILECIGKLESVAVKEFNAVEFHGVV